MSPKYACKYCKDSFSLREDAKKHIIKEHFFTYFSIVKDVDSGVGFYRCGICAEMYMTKYNAWNHLILNHFDSFMVTTLKMDQEIAKDRTWRWGDRQLS